MEQPPVIHRLRERYVLTQRYLAGATAVILLSWVIPRIS